MLHLARYSTGENTKITMFEQHTLNTFQYGYTDVVLLLKCQSLLRGVCGCSMREASLPRRAPIGSECLSTTASLTLAGDDMQSSVQSLSDHDDTAMSDSSDSEWCNAVPYDELSELSSSPLGPGHGGGVSLCYPRLSLDRGRQTRFHPPEPRLKPTSGLG